MQCLNWTFWKHTDLILLYNSSLVIMVEWEKELRLEGGEIFSCFLLFKNPSTCWILCWPLRAFSIRRVEVKCVHYFPNRKSTAALTSTSPSMDSDQTLSHPKTFVPTMSLAWDIFAPTWASSIFANDTVLELMYLHHIAFQRQDLFRSHPFAASLASLSLPPRAFRSALFCLASSYSISLSSLLEGTFSGCRLLFISMFPHPMPKPVLKAWNVSAGKT